MSPYRAAPVAAADVSRGRRLPTVLRLAALNLRRVRGPSWYKDSASVVFWGGLFALPLHGLPAFDPVWPWCAAALALGVVATAAEHVMLGWRQVKRMRATMRKMRGTRPCHVCAAGPFEHCDAGLHS